MKVFNVGIVGTGNAAESHFVSLSKNNLFKVRSIYGRNYKRLKQREKKWNIRSYSDIRGMVISEKLDIVLICNENIYHYKDAKKAVEAGCHVVVEKPIDANINNSKKLIKLCKLKNKHLIIVMQKRYDSATNYLKKLIQKKYLGKVISARVEIFMHRNKKYFSNKKWKRNLKMVGGGITLHHAIHSIDQIIYIFNKKIQSVSFWKTNSNYKLPYEDTSGGWIKFSNNLTSSINATVCSHPSLKNRIEIHGQKGSLCLEKNKIYQLPLNENNTGKLIKKFKLNQLGTYDDIWKNFGLTLKNKTKNICSGDKVINTEKTIRFMYESANKEKVIYFK